jgi:putative transcriptional regulator
MAIIINIDVMLAKRKMSVTELAERVGITMANISILKNEKAKAIRLSTLEAICEALDCQPEIFWNINTSYESNAIKDECLSCLQGEYFATRLTHTSHLKRCQEITSKFGICLFSAK